MSASLQASQQPVTGSVRVFAAKIGVIAAVAAGVLAFYAAYGDPHPKANQEAGVPSLVVISVVVAAVLFGVLVPKGLVAIREGRARASRWAVTHGIVAFLACAAFWSGVPIVFGAAGAVLASEGRRYAARRGAGTKSYTTALVLSVFAIVATVVLTVLGNTALARS